MAVVFNQDVPAVIPHTAESRCVHRWCRSTVRIIRLARSLSSKLLLRILVRGRLEPIFPTLGRFSTERSAQKFSYSELQIILSITGGDHWSARTGPGGSAVLYGGDDRPGTMLSLQPGQWARIIGEDRSDLPGALNADLIRSHPPIAFTQKLRSIARTIWLPRHSQRPSTVKSALLTRLDNRFRFS